MPGGGKIGFLSALYRSSGGEQEAPEGSSAAGGSNVSEGSRRRWGRGPGRTRGGKTGGGGQGRTRRSRRERTPSPDLTAAAVAEEEEEEDEDEREQEREQEEPRQEEEDQEEEEEEEEEEEDAAGDTRAVWLRGPSQLPQRPISLARRPMIRPIPDR